MNKHPHAFNPELKPVFSEQLEIASRQQFKTVRQLFSGLIHSHRQQVLPVAYQFVKQGLNQADSHHPDIIPLKQLKHIKFDSTLHQALFEQLFKSAGLVYFAPIILTAPCWLQNISQSATCDQAIAVQLFVLEQHLIQSQPHLELNRLIKSEPKLPKLYEQAFTEQQQSSDSVFELATLQLAMAQFPRVYFPEILGFTLAYCQFTGYLYQHHNALDANQTDDALYLPLLEQLITEYIHCYPAQQKTIIRRIQNGFFLYQIPLQSCVATFQQTLSNTACIEQLIGKIFAHKSRAALGHHRQIKLAGKLLDDWFGQKPFDSAAFLTALKQSAYIDLEHPQQSRLMQLFQFKGPMFGVLNKDEIKLLSNWISEADITPNPAISVNTTASQLLLTDHSQHLPTRSINYSSLSNRELYFYLVNADIYPEVLKKAQNKVQRCLFYTRLWQHPPFKRYQHSLFDAYFTRLYEHEVKAYQPLQGQPKFSRAAYIWGIEQFAPVILADGCWLQGLQQCQFLPFGEIIQPLLNTYFDEIGNGILPQNHPLIYQQLLRSVDTQLPPIASLEFCRHAGFIEQAFDLPTYLLSIGRLPEQFLAELLGLNLAIELSGLGKTYLRLSEALRYWGLDSYIIDIHTSIDNIASGHSALAMQTIRNYLDHIVANQGETERDRHWQRIYTGYQSLSQSSRCFALALLKNYGLKKWRKQL